MGNKSMSYILEALKKSERERQREQEIPQLHTLPPAPMPYVREKSRQVNWFYVAITLLVVSAIGIVYFALSSREPATQQSPQITIQPLAIQPTFENTSPPAQTSAQTDAPTQEVSPSTADAPSAAESFEAPLADEEPQPSQVPAREDTESRQSAEYAEVIEPTPIYTEKETPVSKPPPQDSSSKYKSIPFLEELSPSFQKKVPQLKLAGHVFSPDPNLRMILINNAIVRENDIVEKDYVLDEITPDGIILRTGNTRFRLATK